MESLAGTRVMFAMEGMRNHRSMALSKCEASLQLHGLPTCLRRPGTGRLQTHVILMESVSLWFEGDTSRNVWQGPTGLHISEFLVGMDGQGSTFDAQGQVLKAASCGVNRQYAFTLPRCRLRSQLLNLQRCQRHDVTSLTFDP